MNGRPRSHDEHPRREHDHAEHDGHGHGGHHHHDEGHHHGHGGGLAARARHTLSDLVGAHSHDPADQVDDALEADVRGRRALWISLAGLAVTAVLQGVVVALTGSVALLGDTLHNVADAATAIPLLLAFWLGRRPADDRYTYGYGRAEDLAGVFVVAMIALSSLLAGWEAVDRLLHPREVTGLWAVAAAGVVGFLGNELVARYRIRVGRQIGSAALVADGLHARTDGFTSLAVVLGAAGVALGLPWADPAVGLLIALAIVGVLRQAVVQVGRRLMDAVEPRLVHLAHEAAATTPGVLGVTRLQLRWIGHTLHATARVQVDPTLSFAEAHEVAHVVQTRMHAALPRLGDAVVHPSPADPSHGGAAAASDATGSVTTRANATTPVVCLGHGAPA
ncbi:cation diffusion facilitator family transporter [Arsenicicoccus dermatophilus]|uniref:cation diffusion facilitator family transporter n=1 Tax=Arsenicicoccus dermatophilus TaxID=1076331 RepID=UPI001F4C854D|nr:cation diffusion facilitator family transporter [Arsenicicoccus dermatophilus]MCH8612439.1 cation diffusion facilitator family transporter [Arsenicicoccus dermatophilus]